VRGLAEVYLREGRGQGVAVFFQTAGGEGEEFAAWLRGFGRGQHFEDGRVGDVLVQVRGFLVHVDEQLLLGVGGGQGV